MTRIVDRKLLERVTALDLLFVQYASRKMSTQIAKWERRYTGLFGRGGSITDLPGANFVPTVLGGLEVSVSAGGASIRVSPGQLLYYPANPLALPGFAARPATYTFQDAAPGVTPARPEGDDDTTALYDNAFFRAIPYTFGVALAVEEWWVVYALRATSTTETDTARETFDQVTGAWVAASQAKVAKQLLIFAIARGPASAGFPALPSNAIPLGAILVPIGESDLSSARVFDLRALRHASREPNQIGGVWSVFRFVGVDFFAGHVWAHQRGEVLEARALSGVAINDICSPGATWDPAASPTAPKIAWLYLARAANGAVPRYKQYGAGGVAEDATTDHKFYQAGILVLSPVRPRLGLGPSKNETAGRWDMQSSAPIPLPSYFDSNPPGGRYNFASQAALEGDAICVGMVVYDGISGGKPTVLEVSVTEDGWMRGPGVSARTADDVAGNPIANGYISVAGAAIALGAGPALVGAYAAPIDGAEAVLAGVYSEARVVWSDGSISGTDGSDFQYASVRATGAVARATGDAAIFLKGTKLGSGSMPVGVGSASISAVRLPYGRPLYTLREAVAGGVRLGAWRVVEDAAIRKRYLERRRERRRKRWGERRQARDIRQRDLDRLVAARRWDDNGQVGHDLGSDVDRLGQVCDAENRAAWFRKGNAADASDRRGQERRVVQKDRAECLYCIRLDIE